LHFSIFITHNMDMENREPKDIIGKAQVFETIYEEESKKDARFHPDDQGEYSGFRVLKNVLLSPFFGAVHLDSQEIHGLVDELISNNKTARDFREWIRVSDFDFEFGTLPENARKIYAIGKRMIEGRRKLQNGNK